MQIMHRGKLPFFSSKQRNFIILKDRFIFFDGNEHVSTLCGRRAETAIAALEVHMLSSTA